MEYTINLRKIKALQFLAADRRDVRIYLNGVHVKVVNRTEGAVDVTYTATNGHIVGQMTTWSTAKDQGEPMELIIPEDVLKQIKMGRADPDRALLVVEEGVHSIKLLDGRVYPFVSVDGKYPSNVLDIFNSAQESEPEPAAFDMVLMAQFVKLAKMMDVKHEGHFVIEHKGWNGAPITHSEIQGFKGVIMPFRQ